MLNAWTGLLQFLSVINRSMVKTVKRLFKINQEKQGCLLLCIAVMDHVDQIHDYTTYVVFREISLLLCSHKSCGDKFDSPSNTSLSKLIEDA